MAIINTLRKQIDLPTFEWTRFAPAVSSAVSCSSISDTAVFSVNQGRYIYYLIGAGSFWKYDTWADSYLQLSSPPISVSTFSTMRFSEMQAPESNVISATSTTATIPTYFSKTFKGYDIYITSGTGAGQRRTITDVSDPTIYDIGNATAISNTLGTISITDSLKAWSINQWAGYQVRIIQGSGAGQVRKILYNTSTVLTLADSTISGTEPFCNPMLFSPAIATGSIYQIETCAVTVDTAWLNVPDTTSRFRVQGGNIFLASSNAATPFYSLQQYDVLTDTWYIRTANSANIAAVGTDSTLERTGEGATIWARTTSTVVGTSMTSVVTGTNTTLTDSGQSWTTNQWAGYYVRIFSGTGEGQQSLIASNTATTLTFASMSVAPGATSQYFIEGFDAGIASGAGSTTTLVDSTKNWAVNRWKNYVVKITAGTGKGQYAAILSNTSTTLTFYKAILAATDNTSVYTIIGDPDKLYLVLGNNAGVLIQHLNDDLSTYSKLNDSGLASNGSVQFGSNKQIAIASLSNITTTATVTTATTHNFKVGQSVVVKGATDANFNGTFTIVTVPSLTTFTYTMSGTPAATTLVFSQSTTTLSDANKGWTINQWAGYVVWFNTTAVTAATGVATGQAFQIASNTANTLTLVATATAPTNGVTRYIIGRREQVIGNMVAGIATGASQATTTLQDTNVSSFSGTASISGNTLTVTVVTAGYLGIGSIITGGATAAGTTITAIGPNTFGGVGTYTVSISQSVGSGTLTSTGWAVNIFAGRRLKFLTGTGQQQELLISSNTNNVLTFGAGTAPVAGNTTYSILQQPVRGTGISMNWAFGTTDTTVRGKRMIVPRGGATVNWDVVDLTTDTFDQIAITPQAETLSTGSMYAYDGNDRIYFTKDVTQRLYYLDATTYNVNGAGVYPYLAGSAIIGNRMEVFTTVDGLKYLWLNRHANTECYRELLFF
jgi:hypothetical protein